MGKIISKTINIFDKGMTNDYRTQDTRKSSLIKGFDAHTFAHKLVPFHDSETGDSSASTNQQRNFAIALRTGTTYSIYGLGVTSAGGGVARIHYMDTSDLTGAGWSSPTNADGDNGSISRDLFVEYKRVLYFYSTGTSHNGFCGYDIANTTMYQDSDVAKEVTATNVAQGLVHSADDILYVPYDNLIAIKDNAVSSSPTAGWTLAKLTLPAKFKVTSICEYGIYLAIACSPTSGFGNSIVYLWDRNSTSWNEAIDFGEGNLQILEEIDGYLVGISYVSLPSFTPKLICRVYSGGKPQIINELINETTFSSSDVPITKQKINGSLYFLATITLNGTKQQGLWKIGRNKQTGSWSLVMDRTPNNDTALTSGSLEGFIIVGDYLFFAYISSSAYGLSKTNDTSSYTATSIYETTIQNEGDSSITKKLIGASAIYEPLVSGTAVLKFKKDENLTTSTFTQISSDNTANSLKKAGVLDSTGANLPQYNEIVFRVESTGGAIITGIRYKFEVIDNQII